MDLITQIITNLAMKYPMVVTIFTVVGILRAINKPLFALLHSYAEATVSKKDDEAVLKIESSKAYTSLVFVLDYLMSIKIKK